jgi:SAM-dependent methyltransferase
MQADLERLPFSTASVDIATLSLALHHLPDPISALAEARRVLRPGGRLAVAAWGAEPGSLWRAFAAWSERVGLDEPRVVGLHADTLNTPERLREALVAAGFLSIDVTVERPSLRFPDLDAFWEWRTSFPATFRAVGSLPSEERDRLRAHCLVDLVQLVGAGPVRADQDVLFVVAR